MRPFVGRVGIAFVAFLLVGVAASDASAQVRPFMFKSEGVVALDGSGCSVQVGQATHFGEFRAEGCLPVVGPFINGVAPVVGSETTTAANGDMVFGDAVGTLDINSVPWVADGTITVVGGTGRFAGASGSTSFHDLINPADGSFVGSGSGTISY